MRAPLVGMTPEEFLATLPAERRVALSRLRDVVVGSLPAGYVEKVAYGMLVYSVPLERYPHTYNGQPLMYAAIANQKNYMTLHLMNVYSSADRAESFRRRFVARGRKPDMGKSCVRFRRLEDLPLDLIAETVAATSVDDYIGLVESARAGSARRPTG